MAKTNAALVRRITRLSDRILAPEVTATGIEEEWTPSIEALLIGLCP